MTRIRQNGNVLWLILVAIVLIGALTAMFTRSTSTSDDTGDTEQVSIQASEVLRYMNSVSSAVQNLLARGCGENDLSFWYDSNGDGIENASDKAYNSSSPTDRSCHIFDPLGAGIAQMDAKTAWLNSANSAEANFGQINVTSGTHVLDVGSNTLNELIIQIPYATRALCLEVNNRMGITNPSGEPPLDTNTDNTEFTGTYGAITADGIGNNAGGALLGKMTFCRNRGSNVYQIMHVLIAR